MIFVYNDKNELFLMNHRESIVVLVADEIPENIYFFAELAPMEN